MAVAGGGARQAVAGALQALSKWQDELTAANEHCLAKVLDQTSAAARAVGWPDHVINATRDQLLNAAKMQAQAIDQATALWRKQLESPSPGVRFAKLFAQRQHLPGANFPSELLDFLGIGGQPFAPMLFWMQTAEVWQRNWMSAMTLWADALAHWNLQEKGDERPGSRVRH
jgi:hypothetical protein